MGCGGGRQRREERRGEEGEAVYVGVLCSLPPSSTLHSALLRRQLFHQQSACDGEM